MKKAIILFLSIFAFSIATNAQETKLHASQINASGATNGQVLKFNTATGFYEPGNEMAGDNWGTQVVVSDATLSGDGAGTPLSVVGVLTDDQKIDSFAITANTLRISLESDAELPKSVDLSPYLDNTDAQDLSLATNTLSLTGDGTTVDLSGYLDNTDTQDLGYTAATGVLTLVGSPNVTVTVSDQFSEETFTGLSAGNTVTITGNFPTDLDGVLIIRALPQRIGGVLLDCSIAGKVVTFNLRNFQDGETVVVKYPN